MAYFDALTTTQVAALTTTQIAALTTTDLDSLQTSQVSSLTTTSIAALTVTNIVGLTTTVMPYLTVTQMGALETTDIPVIETSDINALTSAQLDALSVTQIGVLTAAQIAAIDGLSLSYSAQWGTVTGNNLSYQVSPATPMPIAIPTGTTWSSGVMPLNGFNSVVAGIKADQVLTVTVQRYIDSAGELPVGAAGTLTSTANVAGYTSALSANVPATHFKVTVQNASGDTAIVSKFGIAVQSN